MEHPRRNAVPPAAPRRFVRPAAATRPGRRLHFRMVPAALCAALGMLALLASTLNLAALIRLSMEGAHPWMGPRAAAAIIDGINVGIALGASRFWMRGRWKAAALLTLAAFAATSFSTSLWQMSEPS